VKDPAPIAAKWCCLVFPLKGKSMTDSRNVNPPSLRRPTEQQPSRDVPDATAHGGLLIVLVLLALIVLGLSLIFSDATADDNKMPKQIRTPAIRENSELPEL